MVLRKNLTASRDFLSQMSEINFGKLLLEFRGLYTNFDLPPTGASIFKEFGNVVETESGVYANLDAISDLILDECVTRLTK
jgi:hypothetical protein